MSAVAIAFLCSLIATILVVRYSHLHEHFTADHDVDGVQKFHTVPVPRIGGLGIVFGLVGASFIRLFQTVDVGLFVFGLLLCALPAFGFGLLEDLTKRIGVKLRLLATAASAGVAGYFWAVGSIACRSLV